MEKFTDNIDISQVVLRNNESSISTTVDAGISEVYIKLNERDFKLTYQVTHKFKHFTVLLCRWFRFAQLAKGKKFRP